MLLQYENHQLSYYETIFPIIIIFLLMLFASNVQHLAVYHSIFHTKVEPHRQVSLQLSDNLHVYALGKLWREAVDV